MRPLGYASDLARACRPSRAARLPVMLIAYFDDSEQTADCPLFAMAGYVATATQWDAFEVAWDDALADEEIEPRCFHMKDFAHHKPPFDDRDKWDNQRRDKLMEHLIKLINDHTMFGVDAVLARKDWLELVPEVMREHQGHEWVVCYQKCISDTLRELARLWRRHHERLLVILDRGNGRWGRIQQRHLEIRNDPVVNAGRTLGPLVNEDRCEFYPLQAADILAYEYALDVRHVREGEWGLDRASFAALCMNGDRPLVGGTIKRDYLKLWVERSMPYFGNDDDSR